MHTGMEAPQGVWWKPVPRVEKIWIRIAFVWCLILFAAMPFWHLRGGQNAAGIRHTVTPEAFRERVDEFVAAYQIGDDRGFPIVAPPPGSDIYLQATMWSWRPILQLEKGAEYTLHLSALDVNHGFSLLPLNVNLQVVPGYDYGLKVTPTQAGDFRIVCNEFCGVGHHLMIGRVIVVDPEAPSTLTTTSESPSVESGPGHAVADADVRHDQFPASHGGTLAAHAAPDTHGAGGAR